MKIIGIYTGDIICYDGHWDEDKVLKKGAGGSETWAAMLSISLENKGFHVMLFGNPQIHHFSKSGVEYIPFEEFPLIAKYQHFDYFIFSRNIESVDCIDINCKYIYVMAHDTVLINDQNCEKIFPKIKGVSVLSEYHYKLFKENYGRRGLKDEQLFITSNGVDASLYQDIDENKKENTMVWSSTLDRGLSRFMLNIFPLIKKEIPDFRVKVATYAADVVNRYSFDDNCQYLGCLSKKDLSNEQKKAKIWVYPNIGWMDNRIFFHETFCITALENAMANNAIVCMNKKDGIDTTLKEYYGFIDGDLFDEYSVIYPEVFERVYQEFADKSIAILKNDNYRKVLAHEARLLASKYTWDYAADLWIKRWKEDEEKDSI